MIEPVREFDATRINKILNHPKVRPYVAEMGVVEIDISGAVANTANVLLMGEHGGVIFFRLMPGVYEAHTQCLPAGNGQWIQDFARAVTRWMFTKTECYEIVTRIPQTHAPARRLAIRTGLQFEFSRHKECHWRGVLQDADIHSFRIQDWARRTVELDEVGREFHKFLHSEAKRLGISQEAHAEDLNHNRYVGASLEMVQSGQPQKGVNFYNRWALLSRHPVVTLTNLNPITIRFDIGDLIFENGTRRVERMDMAA